MEKTTLFNSIHNLRYLFNIPIILTESVLLLFHCVLKWNNKKKNDFVIQDQVYCDTLTLSKVAIQSDSDNLRYCHEQKWEAYITERGNIDYPVQHNLKQTL